jgi:hypothetical protein
MFTKRFDLQPCEPFFHINREKLLTAKPQCNAIEMQKELPRNNGRVKSITITLPERL